jgi:hypothetical protein
MPDGKIRARRNSVGSFKICFCCVIQNLGDDRDNVRQNMFVIIQHMKINGKQNPVFASKERLLAEISKTGISKTKYAPY